MRFGRSTRSTGPRLLPDLRHASISYFFDGRCADGVSFANRTIGRRAGYCRIGPDWASVATQPAGLLPAVQHGGHGHRRVEQLLHVRAVPVRPLDAGHEGKLEHQPEPERLRTLFDSGLPDGLADGVRARDRRAGDERIARGQPGHQRRQDEQLLAGRELGDPADADHGRQLRFRAPGHERGEHVDGGHGRPGNIEVDDGRLLGAEGLYKFLETKGVNVKKFDSVRMMSCYSADLDSYLPSLAESFARISGRDVKGYHGKILTNRQSVFKGIEVGEKSSMVRLLSINKGHDEESEAYLRKMGGTYNSQTFPARKLAESNHDVRK